MITNRTIDKQEEQDFRFLKKWLPKMSGVSRAYLMGASKALLHVQILQEKGAGKKPDQCW
jgi:hypothetical protein